MDRPKRATTASVRFGSPKSAAISALAPADDSAATPAVAELPEEDPPVHSSDDDIEPKPRTKGRKRSVLKSTESESSSESSSDSDSKAAARPKPKKTAKAAPKKAPKAAPKVHPPTLASTKEMIEPADPLEIVFSEAEAPSIAPPQPPDDSMNQKPNSSKTEFLNLPLNDPCCIEIDDQHGKWVLCKCGDKKTYAE